MGSDISQRIWRSRQAEWRASAELATELQELQRKAKERLLKSRLKQAEALQKLWDKRW